MNPNMTREEFERELAEISAPLCGDEYGRPSCSLDDLKRVVGFENVLHIPVKRLSGDIETKVFVILQGGELFCAPTLVTPLFSNRFNVLLHAAKWGFRAQSLLRDAKEETSFLLAKIDSITRVL